MKPISAKSGKAGLQIFESHLRALTALSTAFHVYDRFGNQRSLFPSQSAMNQTLSLLGGRMEDDPDKLDLGIHSSIQVGFLQDAVLGAPSDDSEISWDSDVGLDEEFLESEIGNAEELSRALIETASFLQTYNWSKEEIFHGRITEEEMRKARYDHNSQLITKTLINELKNQVIVSAVSIRTSFFLEILKQLFRINKSIIPNDVKFDFHEILEIGNWDEFLDYSFSKYVNTQGWRRGLKSQLKFFSLVLDQPIRLDSKYLDICEETEAYRHALMHGSKVNDSLLRRLGSTELNIGDELEFSDQKLQQIFDANIRLFHQMARSAFSYLGLPGPLLEYVADPKIIDPEE